GPTAAFAPALPNVFWNRRRPEAGRHRSHGRPRAPLPDRSRSPAEPWPTGRLARIPPATGEPSWLSHGQYPPEPATTFWAAANPAGAGRDLRSSPRRSPPPASGGFGGD